MASDRNDPVQRRADGVRCHCNWDHDTANDTRQSRKVYKPDTKIEADYIAQGYRAGGTKRPLGSET